MDPPRHNLGQRVNQPDGRRCNSSPRPRTQSIGSVGPFSRAKLDHFWRAPKRTPVNRRSSVESAQTTSKPASDVAPGSVWTMPAYGPDGVRHRGGAILFQALAWNRGNLRRRCQAKGPSLKSEADSSEAPSRDGAVRSSVETAVMAGERRDGVIWRAWEINRATGRNPA